MTIPYFNYPTCLPSVPEELLETFDAVNSRQKPSTDTKRDSRWEENPTWPISIHDVSPELKEWINSVFSPLLGTRVAAHYMIIRQSDIHNIHRDTTRDMSFNYIINSGGDVVTRMYDEDKNQVDSLTLDERRWCQLKVSGLHDIHFNEYKQPRFSIIVTPPKSIGLIALP